MTHTLDNPRLLAAPFQVQDCLHVIGRSLWLYLWLARNANARGIVCRQVGSIARDLQAPEGEVTNWLERLVAAKLIEVQTPPPFLVAKLAFWSGSVSSTDQKSSHADENPSAEQAPEPVRIEELASMQQQASLLQSNHGVGSPREGVFADVVAVIGEADAESIREHLDDFPDALVREALERVRRTPAHKIRKTRLALFRYLLSKLTQTAPHV